MFTKTEKPVDQQIDQGNQQPETPPKSDHRPRINPRLVFVDPRVFFDDLLMEQQEQG